MRDFSISTIKEVYNGIKDLSISETILLIFYLLIIFICWFIIIGAIII